MIYSMHILLINYLLHLARSHKFGRQSQANMDDDDVDDDDDDDGDRGGCSGRLNGYAEGTGKNTLGQCFPTFSMSPLEENTYFFKIDLLSSY
jgi:hypothetical protein